MSATSVSTRRSANKGIDLVQLLLHHLDGGPNEAIKDLIWLDKSKRRFKMPWVHSGKKGYDINVDGQLLLVYETSKGRTPSRYTPSEMKARFRNSLNKYKHRIRCIQKETVSARRCVKEGRVQCRVYQFVDPIENTEDMMDETDDATDDQTEAAVGIDPLLLSPNGIIDVGYQLDWQGAYMRNFAENQAIIPTDSSSVPVWEKLFSDDAEFTQPETVMEVTDQEVVDEQEPLSGVDEWMNTDALFATGSPSPSIDPAAYCGDDLVNLALSTELLQLEPSDQPDLQPAQVYYILANTPNHQLYNTTPNKQLSNTAPNNTYDKTTPTNNQYCNATSTNTTANQLIELIDWDQVDLAWATELVDEWVSERVGQ